MENEREQQYSGNTQNKRYSNRHTDFFEIEEDEPIYPTTINEDHDGRRTSHKAKNGVRDSNARATMGNASGSINSRT